MLESLQIPSIVASYVLDEDFYKIKAEILPEEDTQNENQTQERISQNVVKSILNGETRENHVIYWYFCSLPFISQVELNKHHTTAHISEKIYAFKCIICDEKFLTNYDLYLHGRNQHEFEERTSRVVVSEFYEPVVPPPPELQVQNGIYNTYECEKCQAGFNSRIGLVSHYKVHFAPSVKAEKTGEFNCEHWGKSLGSRRAINRHKRTVHKDAEPDELILPI